ncbi:hypothetical protein K458DRAFT_427806 [Lentithecium fluviatile CBS 122367]|uniref:HIT-type domain-containing protein n=1 Tax=Lentithecium fluviatile CBS 122367 TaxID=1168545 RepID=A0A6G1JHH7_9PLEO|nr:hypothetical protein K458DRAFT_427806 [Lentithecium fluviatile CBS 122367]
MADTLCGICHAQPKKYRCPTCSMPYCSMPCFKEHKATHSDSAPTPPTAAPEHDLPNPPPPKPLPRYLRSKIDFAQLATDPKYLDLLKRHPALLPTLQRIYSATIEPDPDQERRRRVIQGWRGRWRGSRGRGGGRGGRGFRDEESRWTQKKGDADAMRGLKRVRECENGSEEKEGLAEFVRLVEEIFGEKEKDGGDPGGEKAVNTL